MSLLSDLLSKIKHPEPRKDVPPGLRSMVSTLKKKEFNRRRLALFMALAVMALGSGFVTVYLVGIYLTKDVKQVAEYKRPISEHRAESKIEQNNPPIPPLVKGGEGGLRAIGKGQLMVNSQEKKVEMVRTQKEGEEKRERKTQPETVEVADIEKPKADSSEKDLYLYMAGNYESRKDYPNALDSYKKVLSIEPGNYRVMNNIASILLQINSPEEAKTYLQKAFNIKNDYVPGLINMGIAFARLGETEKAEGFLMRAHTLEPDNRRTILNIAILYEKKGNYEKAREYYLRLQRLGDMEGSLGLERIK